MTSTLIAGLLTGLTYALLGVGVVLVYKTAGFLNLAHAQLGEARPRRRMELLAGLPACGRKRRRDRGPR